MKRIISPKLLLLSCVFFLLSEQGFSQTITLGSGSDINGITTNSPINIWFRKAVCQMVYTEAELTAAGAVAGDINELGFYISNNPIYNLPDYEIQIKHTTDADASGTLEGGYTTVKTIASYAPAAGGWDMLELDTPFAWDGVQNIVVRVCWSRVPEGRDPSGQLRTYASTDGYKYRRGNGGGSMCGNVPNTVLDTKPQLRLVFQSETTWNGSISSDWFNAGNWSAGVPDQTIDALIPSGVPNYPTLNDLGECKSMILEGDLTLGAIGELEVYENFTSTGTFTDLGGILNFTGVIAHELSAGTDLTIENLRLNSSAGLEVTSGTVIVGTELQINKGIFNTGDAVTIRSNAGGTARIDELSTTCTYTLDMTDAWGDGWNGGFITIFEDGEEIGTFAGLGASSTETFKIVSGATFTVNYTAGSYENENAYTITDEGGTVLFSDGTTLATGDVYTDVASGCSYASTITGDITMERYIDEGETFWRYFASAVEDPTIAQYLDNFTTAGFPGSPFPDFPFNSIYSYDETQPAGEGYIACTGTDQVIEVGQGYQVWSGDTITGTDPFLVDLVGPPNQGDINLPVTYTPSADPGEDGWCQVGNPYASTIDWDSPNWTKTNMANATYIQDPDTQNYATYIAGAGANGGSRYIASQQSFWVNATAASPVLMATEGVKSDVDATFFTPGEIYNQGMTIRLSGGAMQDEAVLRHIDEASDDFEPAYDAVKLFGGWGVNPQLSLVNNEAKDLTVHSFDRAFSEWDIPMRAIVFETGTYELQFENLFELGVPCVKLEDTYSGEFYPIDEETVLTFELYDTTYAPRFIIHVGRNFDFWKDQVTCKDHADGTFYLDLDQEEELEYELIAGDWSEIRTGFADPLEVEDLEAGFYELSIEGLEDLCETDTFSFNIYEPERIESEAVITDETYGSDGVIEVSVLGGIGPYSYEWSNGDTAPTIFGLPAGVYDLAIIDANSCVLDTSYTIKSQVDLDEHKGELLQFIYNRLEKRLYILGESMIQKDIITLYSSNGQLVQVYEIGGEQNSHQLDLPNGITAGVYVLRSQSVGWTYRFVY